VSADPPELATNDEWRAIAVRARKDAKLSQRELGAKVGTSQNMISEIETGGVSSSGFIGPICKVLKIPPPVHYEDDDQKAWSQLGHLLRTKNLSQFRRLMALAETMVDAPAEAPAAAPADELGDRPERK
jgi:transcriptional regulator with XRE-family HTH domain